MLDNIVDGTYYIPYSKKPWSIAPLFTFEFNIGNNFYIDWLINYEYQFPIKDYRYGYVHAPTISLPTYSSSMTEQEACQTLELYNQEFIYRTTLQSFHATINPGAKIQTNIAFACKTHDINTTIGFDLWFKEGESISEILSPVNNRLVYTLMPSATQGKIFGSFQCVKNKWDIDWSLKVASDITVFSAGIGKEYVIAITLGAEF